MGGYLLSLAQITTRGSVIAIFHFDVSESSDVYKQQSNLTSNAQMWKAVKSKKKKKGALLLSREYCLRRRHCKRLFIPKRNT